MFNGKRFLTRGVEEKIPVMIQIFIWECIDKLDIEKDYLQIFNLSADENGCQIIIHKQEQPEYECVYKLDVPFKAVNAKIYVIDDYYEDTDEHISTMLLSSEY